jgi:hypothetical protein
MPLSTIFQLNVPNDPESNLAWMILKALLLKNVPNDPESNLAWMILKALLLKNVPNDPESNQAKFDSGSLGTIFNSNALTFRPSLIQTG